MAGKQVQMNGSSLFSLPFVVQNENSKKKFLKIFETQKKLKFPAAALYNVLRPQLPSFRNKLECLSMSVTSTPDSYVWVSLS